MSFVRSQGNIPSHQPVFRVETGVYSDLNHILMVKRQVEFQLDLLQSIQDLYMKARNRAVAEKEGDQAFEELQTAGGGRVGMTQTQVLATATGGAGAKDQKEAFFHEMEEFLGRPLDAKAKKHFSKFLSMKMSLSKMRSQLEQMSNNPLQNRPSSLKKAKQEMRQALPKSAEREIEAEEEKPSDIKPSDAKGPPSLQADAQKSPAQWTLWLLDWLVTQRILPGAYNQMNMFAQAAALHNKEMNALQYIEYMLIRQGRLKSPIPSGIWSQFKNNEARWKNRTWWKNHPSIIKEFYKDIQPFFQILASIKNALSLFKTDPSVYKQFQTILKDFNGAIGPSGKILKGGFWRFMTRIASAYKDGYSALFANGSQNFFQNAYGFANLVHAKEFLTQISNGITVEKKNPWWDQALNNMGNTGPWAQINQDFQALNNSLTNKSTQDQTNLRTAFLALSAKINASSDLLNTTGQMLRAIAQNMRSSA